MGQHNILCAYFSLRGETYVNGHIEIREKGNTEVVVERLAELKEMDRFYIKKVDAYPFTYKETVEIAKAEWKADARPEITDKVDHMEQYDTVILGYPNRCHTMPKAVFTFLEAYDFSGKKIVPFCTNEGSGLGASVEDIKKLCPSSIVTAGTSIHGAEAATVTEELKQILAQVEE